ncbi:LysM peptidoglycan-binding domain-containing protein [Gracilimonas sediminicola]|uniref:LysM peptidoglycan-binding domain-containing protein n=1 Tax=Gracilimonas sediminicola TaxID=2952158 RepID=A0A9X2L3A0_9BACT|nr:LysM peptidoglycan-binding domain-containing protein [Gracilimonas sediminicola]MCP9291440.1 LysM peptidoglycan-binding domain-containing protein [Gracilimonas sediminicola]
MKNTPGFLRILSALIVFMLFTGAGLLAQERATYQVKQGDTLYGISKKLNVTIAELKQWNELTGNEIELGQELVYFILEEEENQPEPPAEEENSDPLVNQSSDSKNVFYIVKSGDTLYQIARDHNMTVAQLRELNNISGSNLSIGQRLAVKKKVSAAPSVSEFSEESSPQGVFSIYEVQQGEGLSELLSKFKMTEQEFQSLNPELQPNLLAEGQEVTVLLPPSRKYENPYLQKANLQDLGEVNVMKYEESEIGETTTNGELYDPEALTAAHSNIALGSIIFVENTQTGNGLYVRINDRITGAGLKLSGNAFSTLRLDESSRPAVTIYTEIND